jgi:hypothetical protein
MYFRNVGNIPTWRNHPEARLDYVLCIGSQHLGLTIHDSRGNEVGTDIHVSFP